jgi:hypothetical protein
MAFKSFNPMYCRNLFSFICKQNILESPELTIRYIILIKCDQRKKTCISGIMVCVLASSVVDRGFKDNVSIQWVSSIKIKLLVLF